MKITVIGATGMIGSRVVAEAVRRNHEVTATSRSGKMVEGAASSRVLHIDDTSAVVDAINGSDATVLSVPPDRSGGPHGPMIQAHQNIIDARPTGAFLVVGGAGSLEVDGVRLKDTPEFPADYYQEASTFSDILDLYRNSSGLKWTMLSPAPVIAPGTRSGKYRTGTDSPIGESVSAEDFAVAIIDELENPSHTGTRFTVAN